MSWTPGPWEWPLKQRARFWDSVRVLGPDECWEWQGRTWQGYGLFSFGHRGQARAHRVAWQLRYRTPLEPGEHVLHRCDNPPCCNPAHLFTGTQADNMADMDRKGRRRTRVSLGTDHGRAKLTEDQVRDIRRLYGTVPTSELAGRFGVGKWAIQRCAKGRTYANVR